MAYVDHNQGGAPGTDIARPGSGGQPGEARPGIKYEESLRHSLSQKQQKNAIRMTAPYPMWNSQANSEYSCNHIHPNRCFICTMSNACRFAGVSA